MQDGGVVTVAMISRDACKISIRITIANNSGITEQPTLVTKSKINRPYYYESSKYFRYKRAVRSRTRSRPRPRI